MAYKTNNPLSGNSEGNSQTNYKTNNININTMEIHETTDFDFNGFEPAKLTPNEQCEMSYYNTRYSDVFDSMITLEDLVYKIQVGDETFNRLTAEAKTLAHIIYYKGTKNIDTCNTFEKYYDKNVWSIEACKVRYDEIKLLLAGVNPNWFMGERRAVNVVSEPYILMFDLDVFPDLETREKKFCEIIKDSHVVLCYRTGKGLRLFVRVATDIEGYKQAYQDCVEALIVGTFGLEHDIRATDISRFCGIFHDPNVYVNFESHAFLPMKRFNFHCGKYGKKESNTTYKNFEPYTLDIEESDMSKIILELLSNEFIWIDKQGSGRNDLSFRLGLRCNHYGFDQNKAFNIFCEFLSTNTSSSTSKDISGYRKAFNNGYGTEYLKGHGQLAYKLKPKKEVVLPSKDPQFANVVAPKEPKKVVNTNTYNVYEILERTEEVKSELYTYFDNTDNGMLISPTGSGKTWIVIDYCLDSVKEMMTNEVIGITAPTIALTNQIADDMLKRANERGENPTIIRAVGKKESGGAYWYASFSKVSKEESREPFIFVGTPEQWKVLYNKYMQVDRESGRITLKKLFIDEIHTIAKHTEFREEGLSALSKLIDSGHSVIAMSATPTDSLKQLFTKHFEIKFSTLSKKRQRFEVSRRNKFNTETIKLDVAQSVANGRKAIIYIEHKGELTALKKQFTELGLTCTMVTGDNKIDDSAKAFLSSKQITTDILLCTSVIQDGFSIENCGQVDVFMKYHTRFGCGYEWTSLRQLSARIRDNKEITKVRFYAENRENIVDMKFFGWAEVSYFNYYLGIAKEYSLKASNEVKGKTRGLKTCSIEAQSLLNGDGTINKLLVANKARYEYVKNMNDGAFLSNVMDVMELDNCALTLVEDENYRSELDEQDRLNKLELRKVKDLSTQTILTTIKDTKDGVVEALYQKASKSKKMNSNVYGQDLGICIDLKETNISDDVFNAGDVKVIIERAEYVRNTYNPKTKQLFTEVEMSEVLHDNFSAVQWGAWQRENSHLLMTMGLKPSNKAKAVDRATDVSRATIIEMVAKMAEIDGKKLLMSDIVEALKLDYSIEGYIEYVGEELTSHMVGKLINTFFDCEKKKTKDKDRKDIKYWEIYGKKVGEGTIKEDYIDKREAELARFEQTLQNLIRTGRTC